jgi:hypothetical protein
MLGLTGWFLQLLAKGAVPYTYEHTKRKWDELKNDALIKTANFLCQVNWGKQDERFFYSLMTETLLYLGGRDKKSEIETQVVTYITDRLISSRLRFRDNFYLLVKNILPAYKQLAANLSQSIDKRTFILVTDIKPGDAVYFSNLGIAYVKEVDYNGPTFSVYLMKQGFELDNDKYDFRVISIKGKTKFIPVIFYRN